MNDEMTVLAHRALGDPTRFQIVRFLSCCLRTVEVDYEGGVVGPTAGEICCHITGATKISSTISHHLHELEAAGLICLERRGKHTLCRLRPETLALLANSLLQTSQGVPNDCC
jgi:ArsR family transcriptional regulator, arsenate/arsenite/antimonite-responsive transcriptional repressor